ncbi:PAS domain-containing protein [Leptodesmis sichuanensis]|uniref:PAS domain-containing protein n=1 Tax=Leptodesmis sichuanensis TaxID=2906798 RepID=UPI001F475EDA|nr:PAS domain-containing protein [Leptodesmis sichuanensis]
MGIGEHNLFDGKGDIESDSRSFSEKSTRPDVGWYSISPIPGSETESIQQQVFNILESITDAFVALDRDWRFTYVNQEATRLYAAEQAPVPRLKPPTGSKTNFWPCYPTSCDRP